VSSNGYWVSKDGLRIPKRDNAQRKQWDASYLERLKDYFGDDKDNEYVPALLPVSDIEGNHSVFESNPRIPFYTRLYRQDVREVPPVLVTQSPNGTYRMRDGNHRHEAARRAGVSHIHALIQRPKKAPKTKASTPHVFTGKKTVKLGSKPMKKSEVPTDFFDLSKHERETPPELPKRIARAVWALHQPGVLTDELRRPEYRSNPDPLAGHCFVATNALFHLIDGAKTGWEMKCIHKEHMKELADDTHWFLQHKKTGHVLDPTAAQFDGIAPYEKGVGKGTSQTGDDVGKPTKRAQVVIDRAKAVMNESPKEYLGTLEHDGDNWYIKPPEMKKAEERRISLDDAHKLYDWFHVTHQEPDEHGQFRAEPRIPMGGMPGEEARTKRVCVGPSVYHCIAGIMGSNAFRTGEDGGWDPDGVPPDESVDLGQYVQDNPEHFSEFVGRHVYGVKKPRGLIIPSEGQVPDAPQTGEAWLTRPTTMQHVGQVALPEWNPKQGYGEPYLQKAEQSPEFQQWFAGSKAVDAQGKPLRFFHGTSKDKDFHTFKVGQRGAWFTDDPEEASAYATSNDSQKHVLDRSTLQYKAVHTSPRVIPVHLSIKNPYTPSFEEFKAMKWAPNYAIAQREMFNKAKAAGYDGANMGAGIWVAFHPHQVKSVFNTKPTQHPAIHKADHWSAADSDQHSLGFTFKSAGFRHIPTGQVHNTGNFHNVEELPGGSAAFNDAEWEAGFLDRDGRFYNRVEAAKEVGHQGHLEASRYQEDDPDPTLEGQHNLPQGKPRWRAKFTPQGDLAKAIVPGTLTSQSDNTLAQEWDYSHLLPQKTRDEGYRIRLRVNRYKGGGYDGKGHFSIYATKTQGGRTRPAGNLTAQFRDKVVQPHAIRVEEHDRRKRLGLSMYEALYAHSRSQLGLTHVDGDVHSTASHLVHKKLSNKHGLDYSAKKNIQPRGGAARYRDEEEWLDTPGHDDDGKYDEYKYKLPDVMEPKAVNSFAEHELPGLLHAHGFRLNIAHAPDTTIGTLHRNGEVLGHVELTPKGHVFEEWTGEDNRVGLRDAVLSVLRGHMGGEAQHDEWNNASRPSKTTAQPMAKAEPTPSFEEGPADGSHITSSHPSYSHGAAAKPFGTEYEGGKNIWGRQHEGKSNKGRTLMVQFSTHLLQGGRKPDDADKYYDKLYSKREGYHRGQDWWEVPQWQAHMAHSMPNTDHYTVRDPEEAIHFMKAAGYDHVAFSALDVNKDFVRRLAQGAPDQHVVVGGYTDMNHFGDLKNVSVHPSVKSFVESEGHTYQPGYDYRHFTGMKTIPRLTLSDGCRHNCTFCCVPKQVDEKSREEILQQADAFAAHLPSDLIYLNDKTFGQAKNHAMLPELYQRIKAKNPAFKGFVIQTTAAQMKRFTPEYLKQAGIRHVELGVESVNDPILKAHKKPATEAIIEDAANKVRAAGASLIPNIMVGLPGENRDTYARTLGWLQKHRDIISHVNAYNLALYDDSELGKKLQVINDADRDENVQAKSWHTDPQAHADFANALFGFASGQLDQPIGHSQELSKTSMEYRIARLRERRPDLENSDIGTTLADGTVVDGSMVKAGKSDKPMMKSPAFRHIASGKVVATPVFHDTAHLGRVAKLKFDKENDEYPEAYTHWEAGFIDHAGNFFNRENALRAVTTAQTPASTISTAMASDGGLESTQYAEDQRKGIFKSEVDHHDPVSCVVMVQDGFGRTLWGKRKDGTYTMPAGHANQNESPPDCAERELMEEAGLKAEALWLIGSGNGNEGPVHVYHAISHGQPRLDLDPDREMASWEWVDCLRGPPEHITANLAHNPNVVYTLFGWEQPSDAASAPQEPSKPSGGSSEGGGP